MSDNINNNPIIVDTSTLPSKYHPIRLQDDFKFDVTKDNTLSIIGMGSNNDKFVTLPDGTKIDLGELTIVKQEDPYDPEILKILNPYLDDGSNDLSSEYIETPYSGLPNDDIQIDMDTTLLVDNSIYLENTQLIQGTYSGSRGLYDLKELIAKYESRGNYDIYNIGVSGLKGVSYTLKPSTQSIGFIKSKQATREMFAVGKYQFIPKTLASVQGKLGLSDNVLFDQKTQEQFIEFLLFKASNSIKNYIKGLNSGSSNDLTNTVQALSQFYASLPTILLKNNKIVGNVNTGSGNTGYFGGVGPNPSNVKTTVKMMCISLINARIGYSGKKPSFIPDYYNTTIV